MLAPVKEFTSLRAALIFGRLAVVFGMDTHIHTRAHTQGEGVEGGGELELSFYC